MIGASVQPRSPCDHLDAIQVGQAQVEYPPGRAGAGRPPPGPAPRCPPRARRMAGPQVDPQRPEDLRLVVDHQHGRHALTVPGRTRRSACPRAGAPSGAWRAGHGRGAAATASWSGRRRAFPRAPASRPSPRSGRGTAPGPSPTPVVLSVSPSRWNGTNIRVQSADRDARPPVDDPQLDPVAQRAAGERGRRARRGVAQRVGGQVGDDPLEDAGVDAPPRAGRRRSAPRPSAGAARGHPATGPRSRPGRPGAGTPPAPRPAAGSCRAGCRPAGPACPATHRRSPAARRGPRRSHCTSVARRLVTAALAEASGVRRSWLTAASSAVRIRSASAIGRAARPPR